PLCMPEPYPVSRARFSADGRMILSAGLSGQLRLWDAATGKILVDYEGHSGIVFDAAFSPDGRQLVSSGQDGTVRLWDVAQGAELRRFAVSNRMMLSVTLSADGALILAGEGAKHSAKESADSRSESEASRIHVWETSTGREF